MKWLYGLVLSLLLVPTLWGIALLVKKLFNVSNKTTRKIIHIGMGAYWIIAMIYFENVLTSLIAPIIYLLLNIISYYYNLVKEIEDEKKDNYGTIFYPLSIIIMVIFAFGIINKPYIGGIGILIMALGDGFAALIGMNVKSIELRNKRSLAGSITMFIVSFIVTLVISLVYSPSLLLVKLILIPIVATLVELYSIKGMDNLTISISTSLIYYLLTLF